MNSLLLGALLFLAVAHPFCPEESVGHAVFLVAVAAVLMAAVWAVSRHRGVLLAGLSLAAPTFLAPWMQPFVERC